MIQTYPSRTATTLRWTGLGLVLVAVFVRALVVIEPLPHWDLDPLLVNAPMTGLGPGGSLLLDVITFVGLSAVLLGAGLARERIAWGLLALMGIGLAVVVHHAGVFSLRDLDDTRLGFNWAAGLASAIAAWYSSRICSCRPP